MQNSGGLTRRNFLQATGSISAAAFTRLGTPVLAAITQAACTAKQQGGKFLVLTDSEASIFSAIAARIIPTTDTPGAAEAGVIYFFDNAFADSMRANLDTARTGLAEFNAALAAANKGPFDMLAAAEQDEFLRSQQDTAFFSLLRLMTIYGFFAMSSYGGNRDNIGWDLIGFEGHHGAWAYPFGYYDAEYAREHADGN